MGAEEQAPQTPVKTGVTAETAVSDASPVRHLQGAPGCVDVWLVTEERQLAVLLCHPLGCHHLT